MDSDEIGSYVGGVCVALLSTSTNATGLFLQKSTHKRRENAGNQPLKPIWKEKRWLLGLFCMFAGSMMSLAVFALLGQSRASAMAAVTIVINAIFSTWFLKERFTIVDLATTVLIAAGTVVSVVFGSAAGGVDVHYDVDVIVTLLHRTIVYIAAAVAVALYICCVTFLWYTRRREKTRSNLEAKLECFVRAFIAGLFSGTTGFLTKSTVVCITNMWNSHDATDLKRIEFYCFLFGLPASLVLQLRYLNGGLRRFDAMEIVPPYQSSIVSIGVAFGWIFFDEASGVETGDMIFFVVGCVISILGITLLVFKKRALHAAKAGTDMALLSPSTSNLPVPASMEGFAVIADPTAALLSDIHEEAQHIRASFSSTREESRPSLSGSVREPNRTYGSTSDRAPLLAPAAKEDKVELTRVHLTDGAAAMQPDATDALAINVKQRRASATATT